MDKKELTTLRKVCLVANVAGPGGAERVACWLANTWSGQGVGITIISLGSSGECFFGLDSSVQWLRIGNEPQEKNLLRSAVLSGQKVWKLRKALRDTKPDCVVSFIDGNNILTLLASRGLKSTVIVSERTDPHGRRLPLRWELLRRLTYPWADGLVTQTEHALSFFPQRLQSIGRIIPNPVLAPNGAILPLRKADPGRLNRTLIGLGRLFPVKGFDRLIEAFSRIAPKHSEWNLVIHGDGPSRPELEQQVSVLGLNNRIFLPGVTRDTYHSLRSADLFVLCSRTEGFPNALAEAMACGLPVVSFDCKSGPRELIRHGIDGVLVPDNNIGALAEQIDRLMGDEAERERLAQRAPDVLQRFSSERVMAMWQQAAEEAVARARSNVNSERDFGIQRA